MWDVVDAVDKSGRRIQPASLGFDRVYFEEGGEYFRVRGLHGRIKDHWKFYSGEADKIETTHPALMFDGTFRLAGDRLELTGTETVHGLGSLILQRAVPSRSMPIRPGTTTSPSP